MNAKFKSEEIFRSVLVFMICTVSVAEQQGVSISQSKGPLNTSTSASKYEYNIDG